MNLEKIPKYIKFLILSNLSSFENIACVSKSWYNIIQSRELYAYLNSIGHCHLKKPERLSDKDWYYRIRKSGDVFLSNEDKTECIKLNLSYIYQIKQYGNKYYFVDIYQNLWLWTYSGGQKYFSSNLDDRFENMIDYRHYGLTYQLISAYISGRSVKLNSIDKLNNVNNQNQTNDESYEKKEFIKINNLENVQSIQPTSLSDFILIDNNLYIVGPISTVFDQYMNFEHELILLFNNVKSIGGSEDLCFYITTDNDLYYIHADFKQKCLNAIFISKNVRTAFSQTIDCNDEIKNVIHFITLDGRQWTFNSDLTLSHASYISPKKPTDLVLNQYLFKKENILDILESDEIMFIYKIASSN